MKLFSEKTVFIVCLVVSSFVFGKEINTSGTLELSRVVSKKTAVRIGFHSNLSSLKKEEIKLLKMVPVADPESDGPEYDVSVEFNIEKSSSPLGRSISNKTKFYEFEWTAKELDVEKASRVLVINPLIVSLEPEESP